MAVYSMTGYASAQQRTVSGAAHTAGTAVSQSRLGIEIRSVNSRFLDLTFRLPEELRQHEPALRDLLGTRLRRGKVEVRAALESSSTEVVPEPSQHLLERLAVVQDRVLGQFPQARALGVADVIRLCAAEQADAGEHREAMLALAQEAIRDLLGSREREGARLALMLSGHLEQLRHLARQAAPLVPIVVEQQRNRFLERWKDAMALGENALPEAARDRALAEATAYAIRIDVAEEITRLQAHLDEIGALIEKGGEIGKRLDFIIQELQREANTLGSKSAALEMTRISVEMKVLIEQMREQVQNIE